MALTSALKLQIHTIYSFLDQTRLLITDMVAELQ